MKKYYEPDSRWEMYQINSEEEYAKAFIIDGCFHNQVPEDVLKSYNTVEYLMAHAYYHWPMYDVAFNKILLTIEMGIKLRAKQINVPIARKKNGKRWERRLSLIINDICNKDHLSDLKQKLERSAGLRDMMVHPKQNSFTGPSGGIHRNIKYCINVLNRLFRDEGWHVNQQKQIREFEEMLTSFKDKLLVIESGGKGEVISSILEFDIIDETLFLACLPVFDVRGMNVNNNSFPDPVSYTIRDYKLSNNQIIGSTLDGDQIKILPTKRKDLHEAFRRFQKYLKDIPKTESKISLNMIAMEAPWLLSQAEYQYHSKYISIK